MARTPEKTSEVEGADILSVANVAEDMTLEIQRSPPQEVAPPVSIAPPRSLRPPASFDLPRVPKVHRDPFRSPKPLPRTITPEVRAPFDSTVEIRKASGIPDRPALATTVAVLVGAGALVGALVLAVSFSTAPKAEAERSIAAAPPAPASDEGELLSPQALPESAAAVEPEPAPPPVAKPARAKAVSGRTSSDKIGVLRLPISVRGVLVDGAPQRVVGGALYLACGAHRIKTPKHASRTVDVPCGRTVFL